MPIPALRYRVIRTSGRRWRARPTSVPRRSRVLLIVSSLRVSLIKQKKNSKILKIIQEWSEYAEIIDTLKKREQEKREAKKKKKKNTKKSNKAFFDPTDKENHEDINYEQQQRPNGMSKLFENDLDGLQETFAHLKASGLASQKPGLSSSLNYVLKE